jgi:dynein heavy chain 1
VLCFFHCPQDSFRRTARGLLHEDQIAFGVRLAQIALEGKAETKDASAALNAPELDFLLRGKLDLGAKLGVTGSALSAELKFSESQRAYLQQLLLLPAFSRLAAHMNANAAQWNRFADALTAKKESGAPAAAADAKSDDAKAVAVRDFTPVGWEDPKASPTTRLFQQMLVCKVLRMDLLSEVASAFVSSVFGADFLNQRHLDLQALVKDESDAHTPLLLCSKPGFDPSQKVDALAASGKNQNYQSFAMGSPEGYEQADAAINKACKTGSWVLLKNVHLSPNWLVKLEKRLHRLPAHPDFRLFMTCEIHPAIPTNLIRMSNVIIFEPAVGIKSSLLRTFAALPAERVNKAPAERSRLYFLLAWLHAVVLERLRYAPVGWTKTFEFSEADQQCAMDAIDEWVDVAAQGRANLPPTKIPWAALQTLLEQVVYGGRIDNVFDQDRLAAFVRGVFTADSYNLAFPLASLFTKDDKVSGYLARLSSFIHSYAVLCCVVL